MNREAVVFTADEGDAIFLLDVFLGHRKGARSPRFERVAEVRPQVLHTCCDRVVRACLNLLTTSGGARAATVLRGDTRVHGRLFDATRAGDMHLQFSEASERFIRAIIKNAHYFFTVQSSKLSKRVAREFLPSDAGTSPGDWLFFALAMQNLDRVHVESTVTNALAGRIATKSPFAALISPERSTSASTVVGVAQPHALMILECLEEWLKRAWTRTLTRGLRIRGTPAQFAEHFERCAATFATYVDALDECERTYLYAPLASCVCDFADFLNDNATGDLRLYYRQEAGATSLQEGDRVLNALASVLRVVDRMRLSTSALAASGYGEARYEEAQITLALLDDAFARRADACEGFARTLEGRIG